MEDSRLSGKNQFDLSALKPLMWWVMSPASANTWQVCIPGGISSWACSLHGCVLRDKFTTKCLRGTTTFINRTHGVGRSQVDFSSVLFLTWLQCGSVTPSHACEHARYKSWRLCWFCDVMITYVPPFLPWFERLTYLLTQLMTILTIVMNFELLLARCQIVG